MHPIRNYPPAANVPQGRIDTIVWELEATVAADQGKPVYKPA
jgi:hypothetical protein